VTQSEPGEAAGAASPVAAPVAASPAPPWLGLGVVFWLVLGAVYAAAEISGLADDLLLPVPLMTALVLARVVDTRVTSPRARRMLAGLVAVGCVGLAAVVWLRGLGVLDVEPGLLVAVLVVIAIVTLAGLIRRVRRPVFRVLGLEPSSAVHAVTAVAVALTLAGSALMFTALQEEPESTIPFYPTAPLTSMLGDAALAFAGVGLFLTRGPRAALARLDLRPLRFRHLGAALLVATAFHVVVGAMEFAESRLLPTVHALEERFQYEFVGVPPIVGGVLVSIAAGVGEEILFRGALQPRLGIVMTSLLFGAVHVQYQVPGMVMIFVVGLALGVLKQRTSTTFTACVHVIYDIGAFVLPDF
jgi:membrane protease YdiL (CAAX protease family)